MIKDWREKYQLFAQQKRHVFFSALWLAVRIDALCCKAAPGLSKCRTSVAKKALDTLAQFFLSISGVLLLQESLHPSLASSKSSCCDKGCHNIHASTESAVRIHVALKGYTGAGTKELMDRRLLLNLALWQGSHLHPIVSLCYISLSREYNATSESVPRCLPHFQLPFPSAASHANHIPRVDQLEESHAHLAGKWSRISPPLLSALQ